MIKLMRLVVTYSVSIFRYKVCISRPTYPHTIGFKQLGRLKRQGGQVKRGHLTPQTKA